MTYIICIFSFILSFNTLAQFDFNKINLNGFGTFSYSRSSSEVPYIAFDGRVKDENNFNSGSRAGLTLNKRFDPRWDFTLQFIAKPDADGELSPRVDILQISWDPIADLSMRAGRVRMPLWMISEYYEVGALIPWVRPPDEVYASLPLEELNGVSATYKILHNSFMSEVDIYTGTSNVLTDGASSIKGRLNNAIGSSISLGYKFLSLRASYLRGHFAANVYTDAISNSSTPGTSIVTNTRTNLNLGSTDFISVGLKSEYLNSLIMTEFAKWESSSSILKENQAYYILAGYYFLDRKILLNFTHSQHTKVDSGISFYSGRQKSKTIGLNYHVNSNIVLKVQNKTVSPDGVTFFSSNPGKKDVNIFETAIDFVF
ncbi:hypothetical protein [Halobacteriovorax sp.]|uniref:hypothetical protein n=1 Tax=Halobacteriovorax sp. TaxID=2020862 RepID=UPI00356A0A7F